MKLLKFAATALFAVSGLGISAADAKPKTRSECVKSYNQQIEACRSDPNTYSICAAVAGDELDICNDNATK